MRITALILIMLMSSCAPTAHDSSSDNIHNSDRDSLKAMPKSDYYNNFRNTRAVLEESGVPEYTLPELLKCLDGSTVRTVEQWETKRRPEIKKLFEEYVYGKAPGKPENMSFKVTSVDENALGGKAIRKEITVNLLGIEDGPFLDILVYLPPGIKKPVPIFFALNFGGNHSICDDKGISLCRSFIPEPFGGDKNNRASEESRGFRKQKWQIEEVLRRGYGLATAYCGDIDPDKVDYSDGIQSHYYKLVQSKPDINEWGTIAAWAWGLSRGMDYFEADGDIDQEKVIVVGHSRLGKTALYAGASDERFAIVISNNSGCGGAALSRRAFGETVGKITHTFPHWFCDNFSNYHLNEENLPVDQHMLIAMVAPRPVYVASAVEDLHADPHGEFLSAKHAQVVYELYGYDQSLLKSWPPPLNKPIIGRVGYHLRSGKHDITAYDWDVYIKFADQHLKESNE